jgi:ABC-type Fe3+ transport system permease subunit
MQGDREVRKRILRRASYYTIGFFLMAVIVAGVGSALVAWFLTLSGLPFRATWIALTISVLVIPVLVMTGNAVRKSFSRRRGRVDGSGQGMTSNGG